MTATPEGKDAAGVSPVDVACSNIVNDPQFRIMMDDRAGVIRVSHLYFRDPADVDRYTRSLVPILDRARRQHGKARMLADLRDAPVRSQPTADRLKVVNETIYYSGDRVALLVESSLLKMQLRRNMVPEYQNIFMSMNAAETWLSAA